MNTEGYEKKPISVGPWGGVDGDRWDDGVYTTIRQLVIGHGAGIDSIQIEFDKKGTSVWSGKHGGSGGIKLDKIKLDFPDEYLTSISGHYGSINNWGPVFVRSLTFQSNRKTYGPFGTQQGYQFSFSMNGGKIVGFHGTSGWYLASIGVYLKSLPKSNSSSSKSLISSQSFVANGSDKIGYNVVQGSVNKGSDTVLAVRQKDDFNNKVSSNKFSRESSSSSSSEGESSDHNLLSLPSNTKNGSLNEGGVVSYGPWGGSGGSIFDDGVYTGVRQVNLTRGGGIVSIKVLYDRNGKAVWGNRYGGSGGMKSDKIVFDYPFEALTHITGHYGPLMYMGPNVIKSLSFHTTKRKYGPHGDEQGTPFSSNLKEGMVVGFFGKRGWYIDSIGVHVIEGKVSTPQPPNMSFNMNDMSVAEMDNPQWSNKLVLAKRGSNDEVTYGVVKEPAPCGPGPWGGDGGRPWDDGVFTGVKQIFLTRGEAICSIQIEYDRNGQSVWSVRHGGSGEVTHKIELEYPHEVITCVCGYYGSISSRDDRMKVIRSLTIFTSRGKYGPYGEEIGTFFTSTTTEGKMVGFHGRSSLYLDAIGVHMQHWLSERRSSKSMFYKIFG